jgi:hypothetical protein
MGEQAAVDLKVRTKPFALRIVRMFCALPRTIQARVLGRQLLRGGIFVASINTAKNRKQKKK